MNPLADMVAKQMEAARLKEDDLWEVTLELWAHAHGYVALYLAAGRFNLSKDEFKALVHRSMRRLFHGLKP